MDDDDDESIVSPLRVGDTINLIAPYKPLNIYVETFIVLTFCCLVVVD